MEFEHITLTLTQKLEEAAKNRQLDEFFSNVFDMCRNHHNFLLPNVILPYFRNYCASLGSLTAHKLALELVEIVRSDQSVIASLTLLHNLICSVQILSSTKLREFVKTDLVKLHNELFLQSKKLSTPPSCALVSYCVFHTILMELMYKDNADQIKLKEIWKEMNKNEKSSENPVLLLSSFLWNLLLGEETNSISKLLVNSVNISRLKKADKIYIQEFVKLVEQHFASIVTHFSNEDLQVLIEFLIDYYIDNSSIEILGKLISAYPELRHNYKDQLIEMCEDVMNKKKIKIIGWDSLLKNENIDRIKNTYKPTMALDFTVLSEIIEKDSSLKLLCEVLRNAKDDKINDFLTTIHADSIAKENLPILFQTLTILAKSERPALLNIATEIFILMSRDDVKVLWKFEFAAAFIHMLKGHQIFHDFVLLAVTLLSTSKSITFQTTSSEKKLTKVIKEAILRAKIIESIFIVPDEASNLFSTIGLELSTLILKVSDLKRTQVFVNYDKNLIDGEHIHQIRRELRHLEHVINTICYKIDKNAKIFVRYIPFVISNCLTSDREPSLTIHRLLSICDQHGIALLSTNLPMVEKRKFATVLPQFQKFNKFEI